VPYRAEHVGSLLRPARLVEAHRRLYGTDQSSILPEHREAGLDELHALEDELIRDVVAKQIDAGVDVVTDGEFRRFLFVNSFYDAVEGVVPSPQPLAFYNETGEAQNYQGPPVIVERLRKVDSPAAREASFLRALTDHPFKVTFPAGSWWCLPFIYQEGMTDKAYESHDELIEHALELHRELIRDAIDAGARNVQLDFPAYPFLMDEDWAGTLRQMGADTDLLLERCVAADSAVVQGMPDGVRFTLHLCRGNWKSRWLTNGSIEPIAEQLFSLPYDAFLVEWENTAREGDYAPLRHVPKGPIVEMGIVSSKVARVESAEELLRALESASAYVDVSQLGICTSCGFATQSLGGNLLDEDAQWLKLEMIGTVADRLWPTR
jgi:5-methyltetrahydropteroyltriglutamate--homocysteine methyltransferase